MTPKPVSRRLFAVALVALAVGLLTASPASAQQYPPPPDPTIVGVSDTTPQPCGQVTVTGSGWQPGTTVDIFFLGELVGQATVDANGNFSTVVTIPCDAPPGEQFLIVEGTGDDGQPKQERIRLVVGGGAPGAVTGVVPFTGANVTVGFLLLVGLIAAGAVTLWLGRRRSAARA